MKSDQDPVDDVTTPGAVLSQQSREHLRRVAESYVDEPARLNWAARSYRKALARHYRYFVPPEASILEIGCGTGELLSLLPNRDISGIDLVESKLEVARRRLPHGSFSRQSGEELDLGRTFDFILISDTLNLAADVQLIFSKLHGISHERTRLVVNFQNQLWRPLLSFASLLRLKRVPPVNNWLSRTDITNLCRLGDWETVCSTSAILLPIPLLGLDRLVNRFVCPLLPALGLAVFIVARPFRSQPRCEAPTVSVVIPARNEAGNIEAAVRRTPDMGAWTELIFIEGHSRDNTWSEIQRMKATSGRRIKILQQSGKGKGNAVREAFSVAEGDILMILDADLTMPPEELPKFYEAVATNKLEFANGSRLVYPMDKRAMRFLNMCANKLFGLAFSWLLKQKLKDTLCGTKVLRREDYLKLAANRQYFGNFDPFGDFDLLFGASKMGLQIGDIPIRYKDRTYGETNIQRWKHGWLLVKMVFFAARRMKFIG
jgi:SAM-dependent methyltransferase